MTVGTNLPRIVVHKVNPPRAIRAVLKVVAPLSRPEGRLIKLGGLCSQPGRGTVIRTMQ